MEAHMISNEFHIDLIKPISNSCQIIILLFLIIQKYYLTLHRKPFTITTMARPIKETPILTGEDAERFVERAERVENMSKEERANNRARLMERVKEARKLITFCW